MPKLLKILTGPQEGAELELDAGIALRMGTDDSCDIAIVDAMAPAQALELVLEGDDVFVTAAAERIFAGDAALPVGEKTTLPDYTILTIGSTRCAIGDTDLKQKKKRNRRSKHPNSLRRRPSPVNSWRNWTNCKANNAPNAAVASPLFHGCC